MQGNEQNDYRQVNPKCSCFNLRRTTRAVTQYYDHMLEPAGIRATQFTLLVSLGTAHARTLTEMAHSLVMDRTTLTRNLKPLEKLGFIHTVDARDRRSKAYVLTQEGRDALAKGLPLWKEAQAKMIGSLGDDRFEHLLRELDAVTKIIGE